jgi:hypothetical protein
MFAKMSFAWLKVEMELKAKLQVTDLMDIRHCRVHKIY